MNLKKYFDLKVGFTCNNFCLHCVITDKKETKDLTTQQIKDVIDTVDADFIIGFTGGEASIRKDWVEICKYAKDTGHMTALQTNGAAFHNKELAHETGKYLDMALVAIHSHIPEIHNRIVDCPASANMFEKTKQGFLNLVEEGIDVKTQTVISKLNIKDLPETYDWIQELVPGISMSLTFPHPNGNALHNHELVVPKYSDIEDEIYRITSKWGKLLTTEAIPMCYLYPNENIVNNLDEGIMRGDRQRRGIDPANKDNAFFNEDGVTESYNNADLSEKRKAHECKYCRWNDRCAGVWKEYAEFYKDELDLVPSIKPEKTWGSLIIGGQPKCVNTCVFCYGTNAPRDPREVFQQFVEEAQYFIDNDFYSVEISGGDPGEFPFIAESVLYLKDAGIQKVQLSTHGRMFANDELAQMMALAGLDYIRIPLYGSTREIHNHTTDFHNLDSLSFDETIEAIKNCAKYGIKVCGSTIINQYNKDDINNIIEMYKDLTNCNMKEMIIGVGLLSETMEENLDWFLPAKDVGPYVENVLENRPELPEHIRFAIMDLPYCTIGKYHENMQFTQMPDLGIHEIEEQNRSKDNSQVPHYRVKQYFNECESCTLKDKCGGIPVNEVKRFGTGNLKAVK